MANIFAYNFQITIFEWKPANFEYYFTEMCCYSLIDIKSALVQESAWHLTGDKPLSETTLTN